ncbi:MAG: hypothetical protein HOQ05_08620 [Corynebacteriales bacterium]|nr:hypothetical protein [Mycobacteriales bacterium]
MEEIFSAWTQAPWSYLVLLLAAIPAVKSGEFIGNVLRRRFRMDED